MPHACASTATREKPSLSEGVIAKLVFSYDNYTKNVIFCSTVPDIELIIIRCKTEKIDINKK